MDDFDDEELDDNAFDDFNDDFLEEDNGNANFQSNNNFQTNGFTPMQNNNQQLTQKNTNTIKTSILLFALGFIIIIVGIKFGKVWLKNSNDKIKNGEDSPLIQIVEDGVVPKEEKTKEEITDPNPIVIEPIDKSWKELKNLPIMSDEQNYQGYFLVIDKKMYIKPSLDNNYELRCALVGTLDGISGEYEIEVPFNSFTKVNNGNAFLVKYSTNIYNGTTIVYGIEY